MRHSRPTASDHVSDIQPDLVILDQDLVKEEPKTIQKIRVLETIKEGKTVYLATSPK